MASRVTRDVRERITHITREDVERVEGVESSTRHSLCHEPLHQIATTEQRVRISVTVASGARLQASAATPLTCGVAIEVPLIVVYESLR